MMRTILALSTLLTVVTCGVIHHDTDGHKATSYQNIHIEHFHSVPTYVKKEHTHLLEHPVSKGSTSSNVEVHHGGKHDHGYAIADTHSNLQQAHEDGGHDFSQYAGGQEHQDYEAAIAGHGEGLEGHEGLEGQGGEEGGHQEFAHYAALQQGYQGGGEEAEGHGDDAQHLQASHHQHLGLGHYH